MGSHYFTLHGFGYYFTGCRQLHMACEVLERVHYVGFALIPIGNVRTCGRLKSFGATGWEVSFAGLYYVIFE